MHNLSIVWGGREIRPGDKQTPTATILGFYLAAGVLMAATVAVLTGLAARRVARTSERDHGYR